MNNDLDEVDGDLRWWRIESSCISMYWFDFCSMVHMMESLEDYKRTHKCKDWTARPASNADKDLPKYMSGYEIKIDKGSS